MSPQIGFHVPDGPEINLEQAMPDEFDAMFGHVPCRVEPNGSTDVAGDDLLSCPFCGGEVRAQENGRAPFFFWEIACDNCDYTAHAQDTRGQAIEAWNRRARIPASIKPLEWEAREKPDINGNRYWRAQTTFDWGYRIYFEDARYVWQHNNADFDTLESAQAAAQTDYEQRIRSALAHPSPQGEAEPVWRSADGSTTKPTIDELQAILDSDDDRSVTINPDGSVTVGEPHPLGDAGDTGPGDLVERLAKEATDLDAYHCYQSAVLMREAAAGLISANKVCDSYAAENQRLFDKAEAAESSLAAEKQRADDEANRANDAEASEMRMAIALSKSEQRADDAETMASKEAGGWFNERKAREAAEQRVVELERERGELVTRLAETCGDKSSCNYVLGEWEGAVAKAEQRVAALEGAASPLLGWLEKLEAEFPDTDDDTILGGIAGISVTFGDLRQLRAALRPAETGEPT